MPNVRIPDALQGRLREIGVHAVEAEEGALGPDHVQVQPNGEIVLRNLIVRDGVLMAHHIEEEIVVDVEPFVPRPHFVNLRQAGDQIRGPNPARERLLGANPVFPTEVIKPRKIGVPLFKHLLENVREIYDVDGYVSGGAIRDTGLGVPYKDVDLFLPLTLKQFKDNSVELGWELRGSMPSKNYLQGTATERFSAVSNGQPIDVVLLGDNKDDPVSKFPAHWTRAKWSIDNEFQYTAEFEADMANKRCTLIKDLPIKQQENLLTRFSQWQERTGLKDWSLEIEGLDKNWFQKYNAEKAMKMKTKKKKTAISALDEYLDNLAPNNIWARAR